MMMGRPQKVANNRITSHPAFAHVIARVGTRLRCCFRHTLPQSGLLHTLCRPLARRGQLLGCGVAAGVVCGGHAALACSHRRRLKLPRRARKHKHRRGARTHRCAQFGTCPCGPRPIDMDAGMADAGGGGDSNGWKARMKRQRVPKRCAQGAGGAAPHGHGAQCGTVAVAAAVAVHGVMA